MGVARALAARRDGVMATGASRVDGATAREPPEVRLLLKSGHNKEETSFRVQCDFMLLV